MSAEVGTRPGVAVLMAVFRDARFLPAQLSSIRAQERVAPDLWVSRDCDEDEVGRVLEEHRLAFGTERFHLRAGPRRGATANFLSLVFDEAIQADYFAYADQDDVWEPDKLARAVAALERLPARGVRPPPGFPFLPFPAQETATTGHAGVPTDRSGRGGQTAWLPTGLAAQQWWGWGQPRPTERSLVT